MSELTVPKKEARKPDLVAGSRIAPIIPRTVDEVARIAAAVVYAGLAPNSYEGRDQEETRSKIMIGVMKGAEVGLPPITALSTIAIINNRPCIWGDGAVALVQARGEVERVSQTYEGEVGADFEDDFTAVYRIWRKGQDIPYEGRFSVGEAKRAHLWGNPKKQPWMLYPRRMLMMRARAYALRDGFADCLSGLSIAEEVQDIPAPPKAVEDTLLDDTPAIELGSEYALLDMPTEPPAEASADLLDDDPEREKQIAEAEARLADERQKELAELE